MMIDAKTVPIMGSDGIKVNSSYLSKDVQIIASILLHNDSEKNPNPYLAAFHAGKHDKSMDRDAILKLLSICDSNSNEVTLSSGWYAMIGSYLAGLLISMNERGKDEGHIFGSLFPFLGVYTEMALQSGNEDMLNMKELSNMLYRYAASHMWITAFVDEAFSISPDQIHKSGLIPIFLKSLQKKIYQLQNIPQEMKGILDERDFIHESLVPLRKVLLDDEKDSDFVEKELSILSDSLMSIVAEATDTPLGRKIRPNADSNVTNSFKNEYKDWTIDASHFLLERYSSKQMLEATQGFYIDLLWTHGSSYIENDIENLKSACVEIKDFFVREWYPEYVRYTKDDISNKSTKDIFAGTFMILLDQLYEIYMRINFPEEENTSDNEKLEKYNRIKSFKNHLSEAFQKDLITMDFPEDMYYNAFDRDRSSTEYMKYLISFFDESMDHQEKMMELREEDESKSSYPPTMEASGSFKYQEKQGSRIGSSISKAYDKAKENKEHIASQMKSITRAVYRWITTDSNNDKLVLDGRKFTFPGLIKRLLISAGIFSTNVVGGICAFIFLWSKQKKANKASKRKMIMMLEEEIQIIDEKIQDASSDGNRQAKYALMRSKNQLQNALNKLKYGMGVDLKDEEAPAVREVRDRAMSGGKIKPNDSIRRVNSRR